MKLHDYQLLAVDYLRGRDRAGLWLDRQKPTRCMGRGYARPMAKAERVCQGCGETHLMGPDQKYHSHPCFVQAMNRDPERQRSKGRVGGTVRGEQLSSAEPRGAYLKKGGEHVHRKVAEEVLGRLLYPNEVVHHEDRDKWNNDPANLVVFPSQAWHARHHKLDHCGPCSCQGIRLGEVMPR